MGCNLDFIQDADFRCVPPSTDIYYQMIVGLCTFSISNCLVCSINSADFCVACIPNFFLFNNTCLEVCPKKTFPYNFVCLSDNIRDANCLNNSINFVVNWDQLNTTIVNTSFAYKYFTKSSILNIPVGNIIKNQINKNLTD